MSKLKLVEKSPLAFGTKAQTLERLLPCLKKASALPLYYFTVSQWQSAPKEVLEIIMAMEWGAGPLIVRSSAGDEDSQHASKAGAYASCLDIVGANALKIAIEKVVASYGVQSSKDDQVLVQPMLKDIMVAGVIFGCDPNTGGPYRVVNYDETGHSDVITSGAGGKLKTFYLHQATKDKASGLQKQVMELADELAELLGTQALDIEFAQVKTGQLVVLQVRQLVMAYQHTQLDKHAAAMERIAGSIQKGMHPHPYLYGKRTVYGVMPDWNPAEIVGIRPRPLALSLYRELVTDAIWAYQRDNYGYGNLRSFPLLIDFEGLPYIDVRASFNSFLPKTLPRELAEKLTNHYIQRLIDTPALHDKVEFEIVYSCYTLDLKDRVTLLKEYGFSDSECQTLVESLTQLTNRIVHRDVGLWKKDRDKITELERRQQVVKDSQMDDISKLYWLVEDCKRYGTLPFAGLARVGFIAVQLLHSFVSVGILSEEEYQNFLSSLECVSTKMSQDLYAMPKAAFLAHYGHLRPGTYDIMSPRYDEAPEQYFDWPSIERERVNTAKAKHAPFSLSLQQLKKIESYIARDGIELDTIGLLEFIKSGIEAREYAKFAFTRNVSDFLQLFERLATAHGFSREDCAYVSLHDVLALYSSTRDIKEWLSQSIARGRERHQMTCSIIMPPLLVSPEDVWQFSMPESQPNYITQKQAEGEIAFANSADFSGKIVMLESADPGYDWLFSHNIAGFITRYGGVNSHMAIRSGELGIPAVIGAGDVLYEQWLRGRRLRLDCMNRQVQVYT